MDSNQKAILESLQTTAPSLAPLYEGAVRMLEDKRFPGRTRFIAHAVREIANRLPGAVAEEVVKNHVDYHHEIGPIADAWKQEGLAGAIVVRAGGEDEPGLRISHGLVAKVNALLEKDRQISARKEGNAQAMILKLIPESSNTVGSIGPIVDHWLDIVEWFAENVHEAEKKRAPIDESALCHKFLAFENALKALLVAFYSGLEEVERVAANANSSTQQPTEGEIEQALSFLLMPQYRSWFFQHLQNPLWLIPLKTKGLFAPPREPVEDDATGGVRYSFWPEVEYLKRMAPDRSTDVLEIIMGLQNVKNPFVKTGCIEALYQMGPTDAARGAKYVKQVMKERTACNWYGEGQAATKLMVKLGEAGRGEAFDIAYTLLDVWIPSGENKRSRRETTARLNTYHYTGVALKSYKTLWETNPDRAVGVLIKILNRHLTELNKDSGYDRSEHFYIGMENLDAIDRLDRTYIAILVKAICEAGKALIEKKPDGTDGLLACLLSRDKAILKRTAMYLLRFVPPGTHKERIAEILLDKQLFEDPGFRYEYDLLLRDKIDEVREAVQGTYAGWIDAIGLDEKQKERFAQWFSETRGRECTPQDIERFENRMRAERIYLVGGQFPQLYAGSKEKAGVTDMELELSLMPQTDRGDFAISEASPITVEHMLTMDPGSVLDYLLDPASCEGKKKPGMWREPKEALAYVFGEVVRQRTPDYVNRGLNEKLIKLDSMFLGTYLNRVMAGVREKDVGGAIWGAWLDLARLTVERGVDKSEYKGCLSDILWTIQEGLGERYHIGSDRQNTEAVWQILKPLVKWKKGEEETEPERHDREDPMQMRCRSIAGEALAQVVSFAVGSKKDQKPYYDECLKEDVRAVFDCVVSNVRRPEVNCTFGSDLARICWLDEEWLRNNLDKILQEEMWDAVWGTHMSWGRPWPRTFRLLAEKGEYQHAIELIGTPNKYKFEKDPEEGLAEHLMIALFNGWFDDGPKAKLLQEFLNKATVKLRGHAAEFLTTGFESLKKEGPNKEITDRLRDYWEMRLVAMSGSVKEDFEEAIGFINWAENSPLESSETLRLLDKTLELTEGKLEDRGYQFTKAVCVMGKGNELRALRCLNRAMADNEAGMYFSLYEKELTELMESIVRLGDDYANVEDIRREAMLLADAYGRKHVYKFRGVFETLSKMARLRDLPLN